MAASDVAPPVVLVHGWGGSFTRTWHDPGIDALLADAGRPVLGVDLLGHGDAPKPHDPEAYADLTAGIADVLPAEGPVDGVAFSLGALTLLRLATAQPDRFRRIVLAGIGDAVLDPDAGASAGGAIAAAVEQGGSEDIVLARFADYAHAEGNDPVALAACMRRPRPEPLTPELLASIRAPVLVVLGARDADGKGERLAASFRDGRFVSLRNVDHFATPEAFGFIDAMLGFLEEA